MGIPRIHKTTISERCENETLTVSDTVTDWALGRFCIHCGRPVSVTIKHN